MKYTILLIIYFGVFWWETKKKSGYKWIIWRSTVWFLWNLGIGHELIVAKLDACEPVILIGGCLTDKTNKLSEHVFIHLLVDVPQGFTLGPLLYLISTFVITFLFMKIS